MTRLSQALERAGAAKDPGPGDAVPGFRAATREDALGEFEAVAEGLGRSVRTRAVTETGASNDERAAAQIPPPIRCPRCERVQRTRANIQGVRERLLRLVRVRLYRCDFCGHGFRRFNIERADLVTDQVGVKMLPIFLPPADGRDFDELIRDIARAERGQHADRAPDSYLISEQAVHPRRAGGANPSVVGHVKRDRSTPVN